MPDHLSNVMANLLNQMTFFEGRALTTFAPSSIIQAIVMRKNIVCLLLAGLCGLPLQAQSMREEGRNEQKVRLTGGVITEANLSGFIHSGIEGGESEMRAGANIGGFLDVAMSTRFSIQGEMLFQYKSSGFTWGGQSGDFQYWGVEIPIYAVYRFTLRKGNRLHVGAGPYTGFGFEGSYKSGGKKTDVYEKDKATGMSALKDSDTGFGLKVGYEFASGLQVNASYKLSVTNVTDANSGEAKLRPQTVALGLAYRFGK